MKRNILSMFSMAFLSVGLFSCNQEGGYDQYKNASEIDFSSVNVKDLKNYDFVGVGTKPAKNKTANRLHMPNSTRNAKTNYSFDSFSELSEDFVSHTPFTLTGIVGEDAKALEFESSLGSERLPTVELKDLPVEYFWNVGSFAYFKFDGIFVKYVERDGKKIIGYIPHDEYENVGYSCTIEVSPSKNGRVVGGIGENAHNANPTGLLLSYSSGKIYEFNEYSDAIDGDARDIVYSLFRSSEIIQIEDGFVALPQDSNEKVASIREINNQIKIQELARMSDIDIAQLEHSYEYCIDIYGNILRNNGTIYSCKDAKVVNANNLLGKEAKLKYDGYHGLIYANVENDYYIYNSAGVFEKMDGKIGWSNREWFVNKCKEDPTYLDGKIGLPGLGFGLIDFPDRSPIEYLGMVKFYEDDSYVYFNNDGSYYLWMIDKAKTEGYSYSLECVNLEEGLKLKYPEYSMGNVFRDNEGYIYIYDANKGIIKYDVSDGQFSEMLSEYDIKEINQTGINGKIRVRGTDDNLNSFDGYLTSDGITYDVSKEYGDYNVYTINPIN